MNLWRPDRWVIEIVIFITVLFFMLLMLKAFGETSFVYEGVLVTILLLSIYLIFSGKIRELRVAGLFGVTMSQPAEIVSPETLDFKPQKGIEKLNHAEFVRRVIPDMPEKKYDTLVLRESDDRSNLNLLGYYLEKLLKWPSFRNVVFLKNDGALEGFMPAKMLLAVIDMKRTPDKKSISNVIRDWEIGTIPGIMTDSLRENDSYADALRAMEENETDTIPVTNRRNQLIGFAYKLEILEKLFLSIGER